MPLNKRIHPQAAEAHAVLRESHELIIRLSDAGKEQRDITGELRVRWVAMASKWREMQERWPGLRENPRRRVTTPGGRQEAWRQFVQD